MSRPPFHVRYGPWALVAGASEGLGAEFARQIARRGVNVYLVARRRELLETLGNEIRAEFGVETQFAAVDLADPSAGVHIADFTTGHDVGLMVYNAAVSLIGPFLDSPVEKHLTEIQVNCAGPLALAHLFGARMAQRGSGGIILLSSMAGFQGTPFVANYAATKAYNRVLGEGLWDEFREYGVDVLACCAGATKTPNYESTNPQALGRLEPPLLEPAQVVSEALDALGNGPSMIPGRINRLASFMMQRVLPRRTAIRTMGKSLRRMYGDGGASSNK